MKPLLMPQKNPDLGTIRYPVFVMDKLDGIRCLIKDGQAISRNGKPIPNKHVQEMLKYCPEGFDGELIVGSSRDPEVYKNTMSGVMSVEGEPNFTYWVFDLWNSEAAYRNRLSIAVTLLLQSKCHSRVPVEFLPFWVAETEAQVLELEAAALENGFEGIILRNPDAPYKFGRCTLKENNSYKLKRFEDDEATLVGMIPLYHNAGEGKRNEMGKIERSIAKENLVAEDRLGAIVVQHPRYGEFQIGTGFNGQERITLWQDREKLIKARKILKFKHFSLGNYDKPRFPVFLGFRSKDDL
jgi:DNA ligase-1